MADNNLTEADRQILEEFRRMTRATGDAAIDLQKANTRAAETAVRLQTSLTQINGGVVKFSKALVDGQEGMSKYSAGVTEFGNGISTIIKGYFGPLGVVLGVLVKALTMTTSAVLKNNTQVLSNYDKLAEFGIAGGFTVEKFQIMARNAGYAGERLGVFVPTITKVGSSLLTIGNSASEGMLRFIEISTVGRDVVSSFRRLGISQEKLTESQADFVRIQGRYGSLYVKDTNQLRQESLKYARNVIELSALTGQSIDQIKKGQEADANDLKFNLAIREEELKSNETVAQRMKDAGVKIREIFTDEAMVDGFRDIMANNAIVGENSVKLVRLLGEPVVEWTKAYKEGRMTMEELLSNIQKTSNVRITEMNSALKANAELRDSMGLTPGFMEGLGKNINKGIGGVVSNQTTAAMAYNGELKDTQIANDNARIALSTAFDNLVALIAGPVNKAFTWAMGGVRIMIKGAMSLLRKAGLPGISDDLIDEMFATVESLQEDIAESDKKQAQARNYLLGFKRLLEQTQGSYNPVDILNRNVTYPAKIEQYERQLNELMIEQSRQKKILQKKLVEEGRLNPALGGAPTEEKTAGQPQIGRSINIMGSSSSDGNITMPSGKSVPISIRNLPSQLNSREENPLLSEAILNKLRDYAASTSETPVAVNVPNADPMKKRILEDAFILLASKLDDLVEKMKENSDMQGQILIQVKK